MPRKVFFSFHYDDVTRANVVRNSDQIVRKYQTAVRFYDKSLWEKAKKEGRLALKRMINGGLEGSSVTCVLVGAQTWQRPWVRYEIIKSLARGNGILGVQIHHVGFAPKRQTNTSASLLMPQPRTNTVGGYRTGSHPPRGNALASAARLRAQRQNSLLSAFLTSGPNAKPIPQPGPNPFRYLGYTIDRRYGMVRFHEVDPGGRWREYSAVKAVPLRYLPWMSRLKDADNLANVFPLYDWKHDRGPSSLPSWIEQAAKQVGR